MTFGHTFGHDFNALGNVRHQYVCLIDLEFHLPCACSVSAEPSMLVMGIADVDRKGIDTSRNYFLIDTTIYFLNAQLL